jgi:glucoamylase
VTDVNAQAGDGRITVGLNAAGTVTGFKYPNPSFYNQVKYYTSGSDASGNPVGALPNEGSFAGVLYTEGGTVHFAWLRDWPHSQAYLTAETPVPVTTYREATLGLTVTDTDLTTESPTNAFVRSFVVQQAAGSPVSSVSLVYYEKFSPVASKLPFAPGQDNCLQQFNDQQQAVYDRRTQAIVHSWLGVDASTGKPSSVAVGFGWDAQTTSHEIGRDAHEPLAPQLGPADGFDQLAASTHSLGGADREVGQATGALTTTLRFDATGRAAARMIIAPAATADGALSALSAERGRPFAAEWSSVQRWWADWLGSAALPATTDQTVVDDAIRALISIRLATDPDTGAIVASADTESPYGEDWIRDGAFINHALDVAGYHGLVTGHNIFEAAAQSSPGNLDPLAPPGNWPMNVYGDGMPGGPIPFEIDETGFGAFTLWDHAQYLPADGYRAYLREVYPAIARAATWLSTCVDPTNGLQCPANEDDSFTPSQTLHGAGPALLGLRSAIAAASALGDPNPEVMVWQQRVATLTAAIDKLYDPAHKAYEEQAGATSAVPVSFSDGGWLLWPVQLHPLTDPRMQGEASAVWSAMLASFAGSSGGYEGKALLGVCAAWSPLTSTQHQALQSELHMMATQLTTDTGLFGEFWQRFPASGPIRPLNDMPHVWAGALFYLSAMCIDPPQH